ncbi:hypothetical protein M5K25_021578 [Dendrobium thyrsiflorum]|uniref:Phosphoglycolate phosphatase n=1 Tax=Dendrobium thyrsiflorum TaxID=117978 RepID=A0ABD0UDJ6_DENTH
MIISRAATLRGKFVLPKWKKPARLLSSTFCRTIFMSRPAMSMAEEKEVKITGLHLRGTEDEPLFENRVAKSHLPRALTSENAIDLLRSIDAFLFDCDGVLWKGNNLIDGVPEALEALRSMGKKLLFVTNDSTKSRRQSAHKFHALGLDVRQEEIFSSSFAAAMYLKLNNFPHDKKVYVIGEEGILEELELAGYTSIGGPEDGKKTIQLRPNFLFEHDKNVCYSLYLPGCLFIATNRDTVGHFTGVQEWPAAGCMVAAICESVQKEPIIVGKPSTFMMDFLLERYQIDTSKMCMIGDRLDTDILFGKNAGCKTLLVLSGHTTLSRLMDPLNSIQPDYYTDIVSDIISLCAE